VGDYSENLVKAVRPYFGELVEHRTPGPGNATLADVRRHRRAVARLVAEGPPGRVLVHAELSTGALSPFWAIAGLKDVPVTDRGLQADCQPDQNKIENHDGNPGSSALAGFLFWAAPGCDAGACGPAGLKRFAVG
jgi:hypothetical protein